MQGYILEILSLLRKKDKGDGMMDEKCWSCMYKCYYADCHSNDPCYYCKNYSNYKKKEIRNESKIQERIRNDCEI